MSDEIELELQHVHLAAEPAWCADAIVSQRNALAPRGLRVRLSYGDGHQLAHEVHGQETPRSHAITLLRDVLEQVGGQVASATLRWDAQGSVRGGVQINLPSGCVSFTVSPGHALAIANRLKVALLGDERLFAQPSTESSAVARQDESIADFLESLDFSGLGA